MTSSSALYRVMISTLYRTSRLLAPQNGASTCAMKKVRRKNVALG
jgi:hypothetical protein